MYRNNNKDYKETDTTFAILTLNRIEAVAKLN